jgi:osmotically-inducible protein OsmY
MNKVNPVCYSITSDMLKKVNKKGFVGTQLPQRVESKVANQTVWSLLLIVVVTLTMSSCAVKNRTIGTFIEDQAITLKAKRVINADKRISKESSLSALSYNEVLLLTGTTSTEAARLDIIRKTSQIPKIRQIHDEISVSKKPNFIATLKNKYLAAKIRAQLITNKHVKSSSIKMVCKDGRVYLMGLVSESEEEFVSTLVRKTIGVKSVVTLFERDKLNTGRKLLNYR